MLADIIRATVQLVFRDRIVAGLVIVFILGIFFCGINSKDGNGHRFLGKQGAADQAGSEQAGGEGQQAGEKGQSAGQGPGAGTGQGGGQGQEGAQGATSQTGQHPQQLAQTPQGAPQPKLEPKLAVDFVRWWLTMALDYSITSPANHKKAMAYAKPSVAKTFTQSFYTAEVMQGVANGTLAGSFEPVTVQAIAINPDGSVVVTVIGNLTLQSSGSQPVSQSLVLEFLVEKDPEGVHMAGFFNKTITNTQPQGQAQTPAEAAPSGPPQFEGQ